MRALRVFLGLIAAVAGLVITTPLLLVAALFKAVAALTGRLARFLEPKFITWDAAVEFHGLTGWKPKPNLDVFALAKEGIFHMTTDGDGWRDRTTTLAQCDVVVFGDSHAFGEGIDDRHYFGNLTEELRVKAIGANGYNSVQAFLWMRELAPSLRGKLVVWLIFLGNDLIDNLEASMQHYPTPFVKESENVPGWELATTHISPAPWPIVPRRYREVNWDRLTKIFSPTFLSERAFAACDYLISQGADLCRSVGARLVIMTIPDSKMLSEQDLCQLSQHGADPKLLDPEIGDRKISATCQRLNIPFVAGNDHFGPSHFQARGDHWNKAGHRRMAELLKELYERQRSCL